MAAIGSVWASGSWAVPAWASGTWATAVVPIPTPIPARYPYQPPQIGAQYTAEQMRAQFAQISRALVPMTHRSVTAATRITIKDKLLLCNGTFAVELLPAYQAMWAEITIKNVGAGVITLTGTVDGVTNPTLATRYAAKTIMSDGRTWHKLYEVV